MLPDDQQSFPTGPRMINPAFGIVLTAACLMLAGAQIWAVAGHIAGNRSLAAQEPAARAIFAAVFLIAAFGIIVALLEYRNARVLLDDEALIACCWTGCKTPVALEDISSLSYIHTDDEKTDVAFHWLYLTTTGGRSVRLAGGPWPAPRTVPLLRHELIDRLDLRETETEEIRWALLFPATRTRWS